MFKDEFEKIINKIYNKKSESTESNHQILRYK